ncbi:MAG TPA: AMP-binding protein, partial [Nonomuraea sp.]|nr:AMP-binding protein [Nonomuraea sp.]
MRVWCVRRDEADTVDMQSYSSATAPTPLLGETIGENLERTVAAFGDREALVDVPGGRRWTYAQLDADVNRLALALLARGIAKGDRVGIWAPNRAEWVLVQYATAKIGAILVNVNPAYRSHELEYVVKQSGMRLLISAQTHKSIDYRAMVEEIGFANAVYLDDPGWDALLAETVEEDRLRARMSELSFDDP